MSGKIKILVADDSIVYRKLLSDIVSQHEDIELIGVAPHGGIALSKIELKKPDLVLLDVAMPEKDGLEIMEIIKQKYPHIDVIFVSGMNRENAEITVKALSMGALDFIPKPITESPAESVKELTAALTPLLNLAKTRAYNRRAKDPSLRVEKVAQEKEDDAADNKTIVFLEKPKEKTKLPDIKPVSVKRKPPKISIIAIGVSTGGPNALNKIIPQLSANLSVPILIVQHMPPTFTASLAARLNDLSDLTVVEASAGEQIENGTVYIAPGGKHMVVRSNASSDPVIGLTEAAPVHNCRPAVDVLFRSVAMVYDQHILSIILTGMGSDGAAGVASIRRRGGYCLVQDEASSVVWGMPGAVKQAGGADEVLSLERIPNRIHDILNVAH